MVISATLSDTPACSNCRAAHVACDRGRPCSRCIRLQKHETCGSVLDGAPPRSGGHRTSQTPATIQNTFGISGPALISTAAYLKAKNILGKQARSDAGTWNAEQYQQMMQQMFPPTPPHSRPISPVNAMTTSAPLQPASQPVKPVESAAVPPADTILPGADGQPPKCPIVFSNALYDCCSMEEYNSDFGVYSSIGTQTTSSSSS